MSSIKELAKHAGVSTATVSRVLNHCETVKDANRQKVLNSVRELGYQMNIQARNLRTNRSNSIIALIPTIRNPLFVEMLDGLLSEAKRASYNVFVGTIEENIENVKPYVSMLFSRQADGIIFFSSTFNREILEGLKDQYPLVLCNEFIPGFEAPLVTIDNEQAGFDAAERLLSKGCRRLAFVAGHRTSPSTAQRIAGYQRALSVHRLAFEEKDILYGSNSDLRDPQIVRDFVACGAYDGFLVNSDLKAALVLNTLVEQLHVPVDQINLVSIDGTYLADITIPSMTTITQPMFEIGAMAAKMLIELLEKRTLEEEVRVLPHRLTIRNT